ncbi:MAG: hypothetical protein VB954_12645 [Thalassolituus sp.]|nr:hypothetical protein [Thalassolituus oleivorans]MBQ0726120.1 hypothetical protein [Thalassolituus oleivorans]MBQ0782234.1 hypothetical protein [Thalassolituus oleivorans]MDF1640742.1 hypothetical protein [Thalassolituus oleivorans]
MTMERIEVLIHNAIAEEKTSHHLQQVLGQRLDQVARVVQLPENDAAQRLCEFVVRYISNVPAMLTDLRDAAQLTGLSHAVEPVIRIAAEFFTTPPQAINSEVGLAALMDEAYLAHRLLEEVNEACIHRIGQPLIPLDMALSNVIIHTLIGEPFANDLDELVEAAVERLLEQPQAYENPTFDSFMKRLGSSNLFQIGQRWSCLSSQMGFASPLL